MQTTENKRKDILFEKNKMPINYKTNSEKNVTKLITSHTPVLLMDESDPYISHLCTVQGSRDYLLARYSVRNEENNGLNTYVHG